MSQGISQLSILAIASFTLILLPLVLALPQGQELHLLFGRGSLQSARGEGLQTRPEISDQIPAACTDICSQFVQIGRCESEPSFCCNNDFLQSTVTCVTCVADVGFPGVPQNYTDTQSQLNLLVDGCVRLNYTVEYAYFPGHTPIRVTPLEEAPGASRTAPQATFRPTSNSAIIDARSCVAGAVVVFLFLAGFSL
ncbi:hypothetical protein FA15DRAFT_700916 [Coprinopsis marcescibilis]|uniref:Extracellular membrane protein CFEM domain-containing protein n=1 Tax=Coprinopsis marcescibilis TaxID=230819 RepID=A0A5C3L884_COPMA|nr:hypothetical protein FA15DRAFT_700916 [Coprinopsis marcescibilis]